MDDIKKIKKSNKKKIIFLVLTIIMFLGISLGAVYFVYVFNDTRNNELATGLISIDFSEGNGVINLENQVPVIDEVGLTNTPYEFTVKNTSVIPINLKLQLEPQSNNTINLGAVRYAFYIDNKLIEIGNVDTKNDNTIYLVNNFQPGATINGKLIWALENSFSFINAFLIESSLTDEKNKELDDNMIEEVAKILIYRTSTKDDGSIECSDKINTENLHNILSFIREYENSLIKTNNKPKTLKNTSN